jgi:hypothetical protein
MAPGSVITKARSSIVVPDSQVEAEVSAEDSGMSRECKNLFKF